MNDPTVIFTDFQEREKVRVSFRQEKGGEVTAVFLGTMHDAKYMQSYSHVGQHSPCSTEWVRSTKMARNYTDLKRELESIGYDVIVSKKMVYPKPGYAVCPKCGRSFKPNKEEYERIAAEEDRNVGQGWKRVSLEEWAIKNHECKNKKNK
jgi:hypothetical protein